MALQTVGGAYELCLRISWNLVSETINKVVAGGGAASIENAKESAYLAYQAAHRFIRGDDA